jgi:FkbM family methyltransferase
LLAVNLGERDGFKMNSYSLNELDIKLSKYLNYSDGFFIEAGANNGIDQSNTYLFEREFGWKGLLIEPNSIKFNECKKNRPNSIVENCALVSENYKDDFIKGNFNEIEDGESLMAMIVDDGDWIDDDLTIRKSYRKNYRQIVSVPATTLTSLLKKYGVNKIDFFSLDVEGYELSVLNGLDFKQFRPSYILIETANDQNYQSIIKDYMQKNNYEFLESLSGNDDLFMDKQL